MVTTYFLLSFQDNWWVGRDSNPQRFYVTVLQTACFTQFAYLPIFKWCRGTESNGRHSVLQTDALPAELPRHIWTFRIWLRDVPRTAKSCSVSPECQSLTSHYGALIKANQPVPLTFDWMQTRCCYTVQ